MSNEDSLRNDIRFNFLISVHGIFEGRGWNVRPEFVDVNGLSIGFFTDFLYKPGEFLNNTLDALINDGIVIGAISPTAVRFCEVLLCVA